MAGEARGDCLEAFIGLAIESFGPLSSLSGSVYQHHARPPGVYKDLDFFWTSSGGALTAVLMATHTAAEKDWSRKFWRNVDELLEAKLSAAGCVVGSVMWESFTKAGLDALWSSISDFEMTLTQSAFPVLGRCMATASSLMSGVTAFDDKVAKLRAVSGLLPEARRFAISLNQQVAACRSTRSPLVTALAARPSAPSALNLPTSNIRAPLNRLFCLDDATVAFSISAVSLKKPPAGVDVALATRLGMLTPGLGGARQTSNLTALLEAVPIPVIHRLLLLTDADVRSRFRSEASNLLVVSKKVDAWRTFWSSLPTQYDIQRALREDADSPGYLIGTALQTPWFFSFFLHFAKAYYEKKNDFGYGWLERERAVTSAVRFWAPAYLRRKPIPSSELPSLSQFMAREVGRWQKAPQKWTGAERRVEEYEEHNVLTNKVDCHSSDPDPTSLVIEDFLQRERSGNWFKEQSHTVLNDLAGVDGAGTVAVYRSGSTLLVGRSVTEGGREHKVKELAGFCRCHLFERLGRAWGPRRAVKRRILVYDGCYRDTDFQHLGAAGFDKCLPAAGLLGLSWSTL